MEAQDIYKRPAGAITYVRNPLSRIHTLSSRGERLRSVLFRRAVSAKKKIWVCVLACWCLCNVGMCVVPQCLVHSSVQQPALALQTCLQLCLAWMTPIIKTDSTVCLNYSRIEINRVHARGENVNKSRGFDIAFRLEKKCLQRKK